MTLATFIAKNALRNKRRAALSVLSVAVSLFLLVTLLVALREMTVPPEDLGAALRVVVRNRVSLANLLPSRQRAIIESMSETRVLKVMASAVVLSPPVPPRAACVADGGFFHIVCPTKLVKFRRAPAAGLFRLVPTP